jgi:hypothetical protein
VLTSSYECPVASMHHTPQISSLWRAAHGSRAKDCEASFVGRERAGKPAPGLNAPIAAHSLVTGAATASGFSWPVKIVFSTAAISITSILPLSDI